jgi:transposase
MEETGAERPVEPGVSDGIERISDVSTDGEDVFGLQQLAEHYQQLIESITKRVETLSATASQSTQCVHQRVCDKELVAVDGAMKQLRIVMKQCEELEVELLKIQQIGFIVDGFRDRILSLEKQLPR